VCEKLIHWNSELHKHTMKKVFIFWIALVLTQRVNAQGVGINETGADPHPSAGLDVNFDNKVFLPPRLTSAQRDAIENPAEGSHIYNLTTKCVEVYYGSSWQSMHCGCSAGPSNLIYTDNGPLSYCINQPIAINSPATQGGNPTAYSSSPILPSGLILNAATGQITGSPSALTAPSTFSIVASNACGSTMRELTIGVIGPPSAPGIISGPSEPDIGFTAGYSIDAVTGATSYTWTVPVGWTIDTGQGTTSISVTVGAGEGEIAVEASNACGASEPLARSVSPWQPITATGGAITEYTADGTNGVLGVQYRVHSYTTIGSSDFSVTNTGSNGELDYLVVGGGGGGAGANGGGGGGGGYREGSMVIASGSYTVVVGNGGQGGNLSTTYAGSSGGNSVFGSVTALGGGTGGTFGQNGQAGGSGGGGGGSNGQVRSGGSGTLDQGNAGGTGNPSASSTVGQRPTAGGGGAGQAGNNAVAPFTCGAGGNGSASSITGTSVMRAGGGGGGSDRSASSMAGAGGNGGGGSGGQTTGSFGVSGAAGVANTGGGGGGGNAGITGGEGDGGNGGSGIVIIRYPLTNPNL